MVTPSPFDQMHAKSMNVGSSAFSSTSNTASSLYLTVGSAPYVDFFYTVLFEFYMLGSRVVSVLDSGAEGHGSNCSCDPVR